MTDLIQLAALAKWLADDNEIPSIGDAACVLDAIEEIERLRDALQRFDTGCRVFDKLTPTCGCIGCVASRALGRLPK